MKDNERKLAIIFGAAAIGLVLFFTYRYYAAAVETRIAKIEEIQGKLKTKKQQVIETVKATKKVNEYEARSLPPEPAIARSRYQHWLLTKIQEAGLRDQVVSPQGQRPVADVYVQQTFTVNGKGRYEQIVKFLDEIYRIDLLHRVSRLSIKPIKDSKDLDLSLTLDALSVRGAPESKELITTKSTRLKLDSAEKYQLAIVGRNIFAPANRPPQISGLGKQKGTTNRSVDIAAKVSDPDPFDYVKLELTKSPSRDARLDSSGKLNWTPKKAGEYEFEITARDDSFPPRVTTEKLVVTVTDPPKLVERPPPPPPEEKLAFDNAKHTLLTAILHVGGEGEAWLYVRPTATTLKLHPGDPFEIGSIKGKVEAVGENEFVFTSSAKKTKGKQYRLARGEVLEQASEVGLTQATEEPAEPATTSVDSEVPVKSLPAAESKAPEKSDTEQPESETTDSKKPASDNAEAPPAKPESSDSEPEAKQAG